MKRNWNRLWMAVRDQAAGRFSDAEARTLCYVLGPVSGAMFLRYRPESWPVRFHAIYSILMSAFGVLAWAALGAAEALSPWFLGVVVRELRLAFELSFLLIWVLLLVSAYQGSRFAMIPALHGLTVRIARRYDRRQHAAR